MGFHMSWVSSTTHRLRAWKAGAQQGAPMGRKGATRRGHPTGPPGGRAPPTTLSLLPKCVPNMSLWMYDMSCTKESLVHHLGNGMHERSSSAWRGAMQTRGMRSAMHELLPFPGHCSPIPAIDFCDIPYRHICTCASLSWPTGRRNRTLKTNRRASPPKAFSCRIALHLTVLPYS